MSQKGAVVACVLTVTVACFGNQLDFALSVVPAAAGPIRY